MAVGNMIRVLKGNREKLIPPTDKTDYLAQGYSVIDENGTVLEQGVKSNHTLKTELDAANKRIAELEKENARLKGKSGRKGKNDEAVEEEANQEQPSLTD